MGFKRLGSQIEAVEQFCVRQELFVGAVAARGEHLMRPKIVERVLDDIQIVYIAGDQISSACAPRVLTWL